MTDHRDRPENEDGEEDIEAQIERIERELAEHFEKGQEQVESELNPLFINPPHPGPIPEALQSRAVEPKEKPPSVMASISGMGTAWGMALDFVVTILAGLGLGWLFDRWRGSSPWGILIGLALGFVAAFVRIIRQTQRQERAEAKAREAARASAGRG